MLAEVRHRVLQLMGVEVRAVPRDGDGDGFYSPWKGAPDKTPVPSRGMVDALSQWRADYARSGHPLGSVNLGLSNVDEVDSSYDIDDPDGLLDDMSAARRKAVGDALFTYATSTTSQWINRQLRDGTVTPQVMAQYVEPLDDAMARAALDRPIVTYRGLHDLPAGWYRDDLTGAAWVERGFVSTSADDRMAADFATQGRSLDPNDDGWGKAIVMTLVVPERVGATRLSEMHRGQAEVLLQRGLRMRVVRDRGVDTDGVRQLDVEVVPLTELSIADLVALLLAEGLPTDGDRETLLNRLYRTD